MATIKGEVQDIPSEVIQVLNTSRIGYLSVTSSKGELYSYPVAYYFSGFKVYFVTPISAAKLKFIRSNPTISFLVDNHLLTRGACGAMIQGRARIFSIAKTVLSILSVGPKMASFARKYPGMFTFYASGKELPDERKLYKYRLIRVDPSKIVYWIGYQFGRYVPKRAENEGDPLARTPEDAKMETLATLMKSADEELPVEPQPPSPESKQWMENLNSKTSEGVLTQDEQQVISSYRSFLRSASASNRTGPELTSEERKLLGKWKKKKNDNE